MSEPGIRIVKIDPVHGNQYLKARIDVAFPSGLVVHRVSVFRRQDGSYSINEPNTPMIGKDGRALTGNDGKTRYWPTISFTDKKTQERWRKAVLDALDLLPAEAIDP